MRTAKTLIRLGGRPGLSEPSLGAQSLCWFCHVSAQTWQRRCQGTAIIIYHNVVIDATGSDDIYRAQKILKLKRFAESDQSPLGPLRVAKDPSLFRAVSQGFDQTARMRLGVFCKRVFCCCFWRVLAHKVYIWAPSSEFVSSSIPSWQTLTAHAHNSEGPGIWFSVWRFLLTHCLYERVAEVLARLRGCAGSPEPSLLA